MSTGLNGFLKPTTFFVISIIAWIVLFVGHQKAVSVDPAASFDVPRSELYELQGTVESVYTSRHGILILDLSGAERKIVIMPNLGVIRPEPRPYDTVRITAVEGYRGSWQPVSARHVVVVESAFDSHIIPTVSISEANQLPSGTTVRLLARGAAASLFRSSSGRTHLRFEIQDVTGRSSGIVWEGNYEDGDMDLFLSNVPLMIIAEVDRFDGQLSFIASSFKELGPGEYDAAALAPVDPVAPVLDLDKVLTNGAGEISLADVREKAQGEAVRVVVRGRSAEVFRSSAGRDHLRFEVEDVTGSAPGIMWEGEWTPAHMKMLRSGDWLLVTAVVDWFQGEVSLIAREISMLQPTGAAGEGVAVDGVAAEDVER